MITNIYLVRHAHSIYSKDELNRPLSERGLKDAERVTELLENESINYVISSPYKRAIQTVQGTAENSRTDIKIVDAFRERKLSEETFKSDEDFQAAVKSVWQDFNLALPGGESSSQAQRRGVRALEDVLKEYRGSSIAIGTHGNIMVLIMNYFNKRYDHDFWSNLDMPDIYKLVFEHDKLINVARVWQRASD